MSAPGHSLNNPLQSVTLDFFLKHEYLRDFLMEHYPQYANLSDFKNAPGPKEGDISLPEVMAHDITLLFAAVGQMRKERELPKEAESEMDEAYGPAYDEAIGLLHDITCHYYTLKSQNQLKYSILISALYQFGNEPWEAFVHKLGDSAEANYSQSFPGLIMHNIQLIEFALRIPKIILLDDAQYLRHSQVLMLARKVFLDHLLTVFFRLQQYDDKAQNTKISQVCLNRATFLYATLLTTIDREIERVRISHLQQLQFRYDPEDVPENAKLKLWFDMLDIYFEISPSMRKLKLYIDSLGVKDMKGWGDAMEERFEDFPEVRKNVQEILQRPLNRDNVVQFAVHIHRSNPAFQKKIKEGFPIVENMKERYAHYLQLMKSKKGNKYVTNFNDIYEFFHSVQEARQGSILFRNFELTFNVKQEKLPPELEAFAKITPEKKQKFLEVLLLTTHSQGYLKNIAWQLIAYNQAKEFDQFLTFMGSTTVASEFDTAIYNCFKDVKAYAVMMAKAQLEAKRRQEEARRKQEEARQKRKAQRFEENVAKLKKVAPTASTTSKDSAVISESYVKQKAAKQALLDQQMKYKGMKKLTSNELLDYLKERRESHRDYINELREKRAQANKEQQKVYQSTEKFVEAEMELLDSVSMEDFHADAGAGADAEEPGSITLDLPAIDKFEKETLEALDGYRDSCSATGERKKEYFENRTLEIQGIIENLRNQTKTEQVEGDAAMSVMDSVRSIMGEVETNMHDLSGELPMNAEEKLGALLKEEEDGFNELMEKEFEIQLRDKTARYHLKHFIILPIPAKQKLQAIKHFKYIETAPVTEKEHQALSNFLSYRSNFSTSYPIDIVNEKTGEIQILKLGNTLWYEKLLYQHLPFGFDKNAKPITLLDLYSLPLHVDPDSLFVQNVQLIEKILNEAEGHTLDEEFREQMIRDIRSKSFEKNIANRLKYLEPGTRFDLFPEGNFNEKVFKEVQDWYLLRREDQQINYYQLKQDGEKVEEGE